MGKYYDTRIKNRRACLEDILSWNKTLIQPYLKRELCLDEMLLFTGHWKYNRYKLPEAIMSNIVVFFKHPMEYLRLTFDILSKN